MVGFPASGKTTWAEKWVKEHPERRYVLLGTNSALEQMKVPGLLHKNNYGERFEHLMDRATGIFNTLLSRASMIPRNFIIDQTNVYKSARRRKLKPFADYRKIAIVVVPRPEELKLRAAKRFKEMGKEVPAEAINSMLANYILPMSKEMPGADEYFDEVLFVELNRAESQRLLDEMKRDLNAKQDVSPYSRESSMQLYGTSLQHCHGASVQSHTGFSFQNQSLSPGVDELYRSYGGGNVPNFAGVESGSFLHRATTDPSRSIIIDHYSATSPSSYHTCDGYAIGSQGPPPNLSATTHPAYHFSTPSTTHGSYPTTNPEPSYGNFPMNVHPAGVHPPPCLPPPRGNFPIGMPRSGVYTPPRPDYH
ncbi:heterogeneous nuclear ribonucleoprotein U-like protein 1 [Abeliophyllum distichum]|uniref:Heterogeneous nuclear ribonucleoprotein U-like protein 1 n=1 Tax=Abeliophyllum distichum TaxID=126358 RepID=A0ABD1PTH9_9LAMI